MATYTPNYNLEKPEASDPFENFRQSYNNNMDEIDRNLGGGGGSGGHTIYDPSGNALAQESGLQFTGSVNVTDDAVNGRTVVDISGGSNLILDAQIFSTEEKQIGVWIDKKPLYQKTWRFNSTIPINANTWTSLGISGADIENLVTRETLDDSGRSNSPVYCGVRNGDVSVYSTIGTDIQTVTLWYTKISDVAGSGGYQAYGFSPVIYSDTERVIGVWTDNRPLYQKTYHFNSLVTLNSNTWVDTGFRISNSVIVGNSVAFRDDNVAGQSFPVIASADVGTDQAIELLQTRNSSITISGFTIQYTKTTDVAGSGDYNTYGVPTHHYSTSEQVVGTYFGKPLYEKTISCGALPNNTSKTVATLNDVRFLVETNGFAYNTNDLTNQRPLPFSAGGSNDIRVDLYDGSLRLVTFTSWSGYEAYITIQYTKTTD